MSPPRPDGRSCPICGKPAQTDFRPFCSKRCKDVDLGRWLKGGYAIPAAAEIDEDEEEAPTRPANDDPGDDADI
jgi:endogenous inhibitor of DNA gyrase (YacG/DUF329 family)